MNKVHLLRPTIDYAGRYTPRRTVCGMVGWRAKNSKTEYETEDRFTALTPSSAPMKLSIAGAVYQEGKGRCP